MTKQARKRTDLVLETRKERVLSLHATGASERRIAEMLGISKTKVHNTIDELRAEAIQSTENIIENLPYERKRCIEGLDKLLKRTNYLLDDKGLELSDRLAAIKVTSDLAEKRLNLHSASQIMQRAVQYQQKLKAKIEQLQRSQPRYEVVTDIVQEAGKPNTVSKTLMRVS